MKQVFNLLLRAAGSNAPVAIYGESGTGKELIARAIHNHCASSAGPFISINPSAIPETLLESELFGHMRGAFTGASSDRVGYIEAAHGGTLFLDEIGDLPLSFQGKFLRVLQERVLHRVGSTKRVSVDFRLITATNRDMSEEVRAGRFREDLYYRIHVFPIHVPPLRQRMGDIPLLAEHFLHRYAADLRRSITGFAPGAVERLLNYDWPGNVRELDNVIHRLVAMKPEDSPVSAADLAGLLPRGTRAFSTSSAEADVIGPAQVAIKPLDEHVRDYVRWVYESLGRNKARTARLLEIDRTTLYRKIKDIDKGG
jgi:two-component system response regulator AtoC